MEETKVSRPLTVIETEINFYKQQTATGIIEIGKRLIEAKAQLEHGQWGKWLEEKVDFSETSAKRFMRVAREFGNSPPVVDLGSRKLFALLDVPSDQRESFVSTPHSTPSGEKTVEEMTTREVEKAVKEWKQKAQDAENKAKEAERKNKELNEMLQRANNLQEKIYELEDELKSRPVVEKEKKVIPEDYEVVKKSLESSKSQYSSLLRDRDEKVKQLQELKRQMDSLKSVSEEEQYAKKLKDSAIFFCARVNEFIEKTGGFVWLSESINELPEYERNSYIKAIDMVESWAFAMKSNMKKYI